MLRMQNIQDDFENRVQENLIECGLDLETINSLGVAVSGGADSISLMESLAVISKKYDFELKVISVNHNIREEAESLGDSMYVEHRCKILKQNGFNVLFNLVSVPRGKILSYADENNLSVEDIARKFRYEIFEDFMEKENVPFIALAHNKNDQIETLLMRFLQGSGTTGMCGIRMIRGKYIRPLLNIDRNHIEDYLKSKNIEWKTDSTNKDCKYLRNRIRNLLVPFLNENFYGYDTALLNGMIKNSYDEEYLAEKADEILWNEKEDCVMCEKSVFSQLPMALQVRFIQKGLILLNLKFRFPFKLINDFIKSAGCKENYSVCFSDVELSACKESICIKKKEIIATDSVFFGIIKEHGEYDFPFGNVVCKAQNGFAKITIKGKCTDFELSDIKLPVCIRSVQSDDRISGSDGKSKAISDILSDWHVKTEIKNQIPVVQELESCNQNIVAIVGSIYGFNNWIVRG